MDAHLQIPITDVDVTPLSGLSFYFSSAADAVMAAAFLATAALTADATALFGSCYFSAAAATATLLAAAVDANSVTFSFHHV